MTSRKTNAARAFTLAAGAAGLLAASALPAAAQDQEIPRGWFKACTEQEDVSICNVQNIMVAETGQLITGVSLIEISGNVDRKVFQITVPSGRMLPPGIGLQIDGGQTRKIDYMICLPDRCVAEAPLTDDLVNSFKRGSQLTMTSVNFQNQQNPINVTLQGFTAAFDGEPLQQSDLEDRQRRLQEYVSRNTDDFARRLREEQERALQGN
jgi:invasion protein IalB